MFGPELLGFSSKADEVSSELRIQIDPQHGTRKFETCGPASVVVELERPYIRSHGRL